MELQFILSLAWILLWLIDTLLPSDGRCSPGGFASRAPPGDVSHGPQEHSSGDCREQERRHDQHPSHRERES